MTDIIENKQPVATVPTKQHWYTGFIGNYGSYAMAGVATVLSSLENINRHFHKVYFEETETFGLSEQAKKSIYDEAAEATKEDGLKLAKKMRELHKRFHDAEKVAERALGIRNQGVTGLFLGSFDKMKNIKPHQQLEVVLKMATVGSLTIGAIFTINRNKNLTARVQYHEKTKDEAVQEQAERQAIADARAGRLPGTEKFAEQRPESAGEPKHFATVDKMAANANALKTDQKHYPALDDMAARVQQHAREQEPAMAQRG